jgi:rod shape-determining protein MreC
VKAKTTGTLAIGVAASTLAVVFFLFRAAAAEAVYPVERAKSVWARRVWTRVKGFFAGAEASAENVRLRREVAALSLLRGDIERLEDENARLRRTLGYAAKEPGVWLPAAVLSRGGSAAGIGRTLRVDKGSLDGVRAGAIVCVPEGLVGRVTHVTPHTGEVTLLSDRTVRVACEVERANGVRLRGILCGGTEDLLVLRHLTNAESATARSRVVTSGLGGVFPKGLEIGTLLDVRRDEKGLAREGEVLPSVDFSMLEDVFIRREK